MASYSNKIGHFRLLKGILLMYFLWFLHVLIAESSTTLGCILHACLANYHTADVLLVVLACLDCRVEHHARVYPACMPRQIVDDVRPLVMST